MTPEPVALDTGLGMDPFVTLIAGLEDDAPSSDFYGKLCAAMCDSVNLERAVIFQYDPDLRRVHPLGSHGITDNVFSEVYVSADSASFVRAALEQDQIVEIAGDELLALTPPAFHELAKGRRAVCTPMIASGRWVGLMLADRPDTAPPLSSQERNLLWTLGKGVALATMARRATRKDERTRMLSERVDLARDVHDLVVQRLFGVAMALEGPGPLPEADRERCAREVQAAMSQLRSVVESHASEAPRAADGTLDDELARWRAAHLDLELVLEQASPDDVPPELLALCQSVLSEGLRNARKHAAPTLIQVRTRRDGGALVMEVENNGAKPRSAASLSPTNKKRESGMGLRLLGIQALHAGGFLEFGSRGDSAWQIRLVVPVPDDE
jgi:signal transduction histidine kinase